MARPARLLGGFNEVCGEAELAQTRVARLALARFHLERAIETLQRC